MAKADKFLFWTPRILVIVFALFLALFSLDIFGNDYTFWETVVGLFMHNIPSMVLLIILAISWKYELVGAIVFGLLGISGFIGSIISMFVAPEAGMFNPIFIITGIVAISTGVLFHLGWRKKR